MGNSHTPSLGVAQCVDSGELLQLGSEPMKTEGVSSRKDAASMVVIEATWVLLLTFSLQEVVPPGSDLTPPLGMG